MKTLDKVITGVVAGQQAGSPTGPALTNTANADRPPRGDGIHDRAGRDHVDAINQIFAEFELAYHNQFHKAYAQEGSLKLAKKYWLHCLGEFTPEVILRAARQVVKHQEYLPTVASMTAACEEALPLFGLPAPLAAYREACNAPEPKALQQWSHPAVYLAGKLTSWFALANETEASIFPLYAYHYDLLCQRVLRGEVLDQPVRTALPAAVSTPLTPEQNKVRMRALRAKFDL